MFYFMPMFWHHIAKNFIWTNWLYMIYITLTAPAEQTDTHTTTAAAHCEHLRQQGRFFSSPELLFCSKVESSDVSFHSQKPAKNSRDHPSFFRLSTQSPSLNWDDRRTDRSSLGRLAIWQIPQMCWVNSWNMIASSSGI